MIKAILRKKVIFISGLIFSILIFSINQSFANGVLRDNIGPVSSGRGGTNIAHADNGTLIYSNPAGLADFKGKNIEACFDFLTFPINYRDPDNDQDAKDSIFFLPSLAYTQHHQQGRFGFGFGIFTPAGFSTDYNLVHPVYGQQRYFSNSSLIKTLLGCGWKMNDQVSVGIGFGPTHNKIEFKEPYTFQTGPLKGNSALTDMEADDCSWACNIGVQWQVSADTTLGLSYAREDQFHLKGDLDMDVTGSPLASLVTDPTARYKLKFDFQWPQVLGIGIKHQIESDHIISMDILWIGWSSAFHELNLKLYDGDNSEFNAMAGTSIEDTIPLHWEDSLALRLGYEYNLSEIDTLRCGYIYNQNPVPSATLTLLIPGTMTHLIAIGYGRHWERWGLNAAYEYSFGPRQSVDKSDIFGGDFDHSSVKASCHLVTIGLQYRF